MKDYSELYDWFLKDIIKPAVIKNGDKVDKLNDIREKLTIDETEVTQS